MELLKQYLIIFIVIYAIIAFTTFELNPAKWAINATENKNNHENNN